MKRNRSLWCLLVGLVGSLAGCSVDSAKNHYLLAEKLWTDRKYGAAVSEFERVTAKDPNGKLGKQALFRAATTQSLFLSQYGDAVRKFREYVQINPDDPSAWQAQLHVGDILYSKLEQYDQAIQHYQKLLKLNPKIPEAPEFLFRIAKSQFYLLRFDEAVSTFQSVEKEYPFTSWAEKAAFETGATYFTRGEQGSRYKNKIADGYSAALHAYERFLGQYPKSTLVSSAQFGVASCLEELNQLEEAFKAFSKLRKSYPSPNVVEIKLSRIQERLAQQNIPRAKQ